MGLAQVMKVGNHKKGQEKEKWTLGELQIEETDSDRDEITSDGKNKKTWKHGKTK